jgi:hypothetical protein
MLSLLVRQRLTMYVKHRQADLDALSRLIEAGQVTPVIDRTYPLSEASAAIRCLAEGHARTDQDPDGLIYGSPSRSGRVFRAGRHWVAMAREPAFRQPLSVRAAS